MTSRKWFPMVAILIVGILAAGTISTSRDRIEAAKWSEGKAGAGRIRTALRSYFAEKGPDYTNYAADLTGGINYFAAPLGFAATDLDGGCFRGADFYIAGVHVVDGKLNYTITIGPSTAAGGPVTPASMTLDQDGTFN